MLGRSAAVAAVVSALLLGWSAADAGAYDGALGLSAANSHTCALDASASISCWGSNVSSVSGPNNAAGVFKAVTTGNFHTCALDSVGSISCWGSSGNGQLANIPAGSFKTISAGATHTCAIDSSDSISCWGSNLSGQSSGPSNAAGSFKAVSAGAFNTCALDSNNSISCWGADIAGNSVGPDAAAGAFGVVDLSMSLKGTPAPLTVGSQLTYQLRMRNAGVFGAFAMTGTLTLSPTVQFVSATSACSHAAGVVTCTIPRAILPGAGATPSVTVQVQQAGVIQSTATVSSGLADSDPDSNTSTEKTRVTP